MENINTDLSQRVSSAYQSIQTEVKNDVLKFLPKRKICNYINTLGKTGIFNYEGKSYQMLKTENEKNKKVYRAQLCYIKNTSAIIIIIGVSLILFGIFFFLIIQFNWRSYEESIKQAQIGYFLIFIGIALASTWYFLFWRKSHNELKTFTNPLVG